MGLQLERRPRSEQGETAIGGLSGRHHFCFATYQRADRIAFGALRKLSRYRLAPGAARKPELVAGYHVVTLPQRGKLRRTGTFSPREPLSPGGVELISPGAGADLGVRATGEEAEFLEIWVAERRPAATPRRLWRSVPPGRTAICAPAGALLPWTSPVTLSWLRPRAAAREGLTLSPGEHAYLALIAGSGELAGLGVNADDALAAIGVGALTFTARSDCEMLWLAGL